MEKQILVTCFEPFGGEAENASMLAVEALPEVKLRPSAPVHALNRLPAGASSAVIVTVSPLAKLPEPEPLLTVTA